jgi:hypothetical protein
MAVETKIECQEPFTALAAVAQNKLSAFGSGLHV